MHDVVCFMLCVYVLDIYKRNVRTVERLITQIFN